MKKNWKTGVCRTVLALSISLAAAGIAMAEEGGDTVFVPGTSVNGLGIADLTVDEAAERIGKITPLRLKNGVESRRQLPENRLVFP